MLDSLKSRLQVAVSFPSPPAIALQIIELANDPQISAGKVANLIAKDPGLATKVLRVANSPMYSKRRKSDNLRQALVTLGLNATVSLALGFSLVSNYQRAKDSGLDYPRFWRRSIFCAAAARHWAGRVADANADDVFLAALLQDIAILAIDRVQRGFYSDLCTQASHQEFIEYEVSRIGADHAALGAWLLRHWKLPESLCATVEASHGSDHGPLTATGQCLSVANRCADALLDAQSADVQALADTASSILQLEPTLALETITTLMGEISEVGRLFDTSIFDADFTSAIADQARELLSVRSAQSDRDVAILTEKTEDLKHRMQELEVKHQRDALTGVYTRAFIDELLLQEFTNAQTSGWPLSVVFADLDAFKKVNDTYGHAVGDAVLAGAAKSIMAVLRDSDYVGRYGGEEFLILLPGVSEDSAGIVCERLLAGLRRTRHSYSAGHIHVTISLGLATHSEQTPFPNAKALTEAADRSLYSAKRGGRDRLVRYGS